jgi:hypothetical protein
MRLENREEVITNQVTSSSPQAYDTTLEMNTQLNDREIIEKSSYSTSRKRKFKTVILIVN